MTVGDLKQWMNEKKLADDVPVVMALGKITPLGRQHLSVDEDRAGEIMVIEETVGI